MSQDTVITTPSPEAAAFELLQRQAKMLSTSTLVPKEFQNNMANCAIGLEIAHRLGASAFMVLQNIDIIHGRPSFRATFLIAMVNASGRFQPLQYRMTGEGMSRECTAWTKDKSGEVIEGPPVSMAMAKAEGWLSKDGSKWQTMPEVMLRYRAAAFFARIYAPDITLGMQTSEEVAEIHERDVTPPARSGPINPFPTQEAPVLPAEVAPAVEDETQPVEVQEEPDMSQALMDAFDAIYASIDAASLTDAASMVSGILSEKEREEAKAKLNSRAIQLKVKWSNKVSAFIPA